MKMTQKKQTFHPSCDSTEQMIDKTQAIFWQDIILLWHDKKVTEQGLRALAKILILKAA